MTNTPSFQDLLAGFADEIFVGRSEQLVLFEQALTAPRPPFLILAVFGQGGVGKTTLLEQFRHIASNQGVLTALADEDQTTIPVTLAHLAQQFTEAGHPFKTFIERYRKYRELKEQVEADPKAPKGMLDFALRSATKIGMRSLRRVPLAGEAAEVLLTEEAEEVVADQVSAMAAYVAQKFSKDDRVLLLETDGELTRCFLSDLNQQAETDRLILFFDTYEKTAPFLETWLLDLLAGKFGSFSGHVSFVIAGRYPLGQAWTRFRKAIRQVELHEFSEAEARDYLTRSGITDEAQIQQLLDLSERLPVLLALLVSTPGEMPTEVAGDAVERFLQGTTSIQREAALATSVPRFFNQDVLAVVLGSEAASSAFDWLSQADFVQAKADGWAYHEVVRGLMLRYFRLRSDKVCTEIHGKLAEYYQIQAETLTLADGGQKLRSNRIWRKYETERLYHRLSQNSQSCLVEVLTGFLTDIEDEIFLRAYVQILVQVAEEINEALLKTWTNRLECLISLFNEEISVEILKASLLVVTPLCDLESLSEQCRSRAYLIRGGIQVMTKDYLAAIADLSKAIELQPENGDNYYGRGRTYWEMKEYPAAVADFSKAIELQPENGDNYAWRGRTYREMKEYPAALADLSKAIELQPEDGYNYQGRGITYLAAKEYPAAVADFSKAIELQPEDGNNYSWRGLTYREMKEYPAAVADFSKAIELQPEIGYVHQGRGRTHLEMKEYPAALADLSKAIELQPENGYNYYWRGRTYLEMKEYPAAAADFSKAIELQPENGYNYRGRGRTHLEMKEYSAALTDFSKAIELQPENRNNYAWRGDTYREMKEYPAAVADFSKAIELQLEEGDNYYGRGRTYWEMKEYSTALADFNKAIELQPENGDNYYWRGLTYLEMKDYPMALVDLNRAIELQPEDAYNYAWRGRTHLALNDIAKAQSDFAQVEALLGEAGRPAYYVAAGYAELSQVEEACIWLRRAFERDKELVGKVEAEADFDPIREATAFQSLLAEFREVAKKD